MSGLILTQNFDAMQAVSQTDGVLSKKSGIAFKRFLNMLWSHYAHYQDGMTRFYFNELSDTDKRLLLSYVIPASEYEWLAQNPVRLQEGIEEERSYMEKVIDNYCDEQWHDVMEEAHYYRMGGSDE